jgi:pilus assembly protein Flp/PilA
LLKLTRPKSGGPIFGPGGGWRAGVAAEGSSKQEYAMPKPMKRIAADESGVTAIEYALIASLIAVFIITPVQTVGTKVSTVFNEVGNTLK